MILILFFTAAALLICLGLVKLSLMYLKSYRILLRSKCFQGPKAWPIIGNAYLIIGCSIDDIHEKILEVFNTYKTTFRIWIGPRLYFAITEPEHVKLILNNPNAMEKDAIYDIIKPLLGNGLLTAPVPKWKLNRRTIQPLFKREVLQSYTKIFMRKALHMAEQIGMVEDGKEFDIYHYLSRYNFESICETSLGIKVNNMDGTLSVFFNVVESALEVLMLRVMSPWLFPDFIFMRTSMGKKLRKNTRYLRDFLYSILNNCRNDILKGIEDKSRQYLLELLLTSKDRKFTDREISDELKTIVGAGFETSTTVMSIMLLALAKHPDIQEKVYAEVREIYDECSSKGLDITLQDFEHMEYLNRVAKEALRFVPVVGIISRYLSEEIDIGEYTLPAGSSLIINIFSIHRNEKYWPNPFEFNPDRFLPLHPLGPRHPCAYLPFSLGARNCIGSKYAMASLKVVIATLVSQYIIKTSMPEDVNDVGLRTCVFLRIKDPIILSFQRRIPEKR